MKISISVPAAVMDQNQNVEVLDPQILRRFDGLKSEETCIDDRTARDLRAMKQCHPPYEAMPLSPR